MPALELMTFVTASLNSRSAFFRAFLAGPGSGRTVQSSRPSADVLDNAANSDGVDAVVHERLERSCAEDFVHVVAKG